MILDYGFGTMTATTFHQSSLQMNMIVILNKKVRMRSLPRSIRKKEDSDDEDNIPLMELSMRLKANKSMERQQNGDSRAEESEVL